MSQARKRVLLVTDDEAVDRSLTKAFTDAAPRLHVDIARTQNDIRLRNERCHLIVLDLLLSRENPFQVLRWLRADERFERTPVVALSSETIKQLANEAYEFGANTCVLREVEADALERIARGIAAFAELASAPGCNCSS
jgi:DNA-binding response OmpR family regulator